MTFARAREIRRLAAVGAFGFVLETAAQACAFYAYRGVPEFAPWLAPVWIVTLWILLAATYNSSLAWLEGKPGLQALIGAVASPASFSAAVGLGAARFIVPAASGRAALALIWAVAFPLSFYVARVAEGSWSKTQS
jgi:hypothetical protein